MKNNMKDLIFINGAGKYLIVFICSLFLIGLIPLVDSASPFATTSDTTLNIEVPAPTTIQINTPYRFHAHVINSTRTKTNVTTTCFLHVYNTTGYDIKESLGLMEFEDYNGVDFAKTINGTEFNRVGNWNFVIQCNSSNEVGFYAGQFQVTNNGLSYSESNLSNDDKTNFIYLLLILATLFIVIGLWKTDANITMLGTIMLFALGLYTLINGFGIYKDTYTNLFSLTLIGVAVIITAKSMESWLDNLNSL